ncbi:kinesin-like protein KIN-5A isoform X2 [Physcomitrium patens]|uniref:Kinesin motor domain-containing protein n=1 Tax=Physcomitrium patens TaxID=3218 RepID=A0A7I4DBU2_PHYPA|nr:kinesin-like protein KIN-5A isoform X2 [Physcomitrium patens]XP_024369375.1 kinesin-like protein KIN-5A isoform X2 [Physcomitrium patens]|eukprot:XP_024369374.1 kinesin-like protein KIN-5A isoform X2 [Physcomitrella patens]
MAARSEKDRSVAVQVLLRCRPLNEEEKRIKNPQVISCNDTRREVTVLQTIASKQIDRTFTFDKVFGPASRQVDLYDQAIAPIVNEALDGFNCTIFAYGQTGTGKTYTMEGLGRKSKNGELPADAGVIPRAIQQIFETLDKENQEYSVKVSYLELYNEELTDLLAPEEYSKVVIDEKIKKPLALMEDGRGGVLVRGLEEEIVTSANEIYTLLDRGSAKRQTAETLLNKQSSRSHSIFSITIHIKETTPEGEELMKCGKLNLVDLAGSENISRSGAKDNRAREAGEINKSLLTLGRVITSLVEHLGHVPYRDSKLTRLLRDSLGGKTKTCIIATVSPSVHCLDETLSTLDYAYRAKNIKNKPEVNQKTMKSALIKDLYGEIEKLKAEVYSARERNGIYIPRERYFEEEAEKKAMVDKIERMGLEVEAKDKQIEDLQMLNEARQQDCAALLTKLNETQKSLECSQQTLHETTENLKQANCAIRERDYVIANQSETEKALVSRAGELREELEATVQDVAGLFAKIERKEDLELKNQKLVNAFQSGLTEHMKELRTLVVVGVGTQQQQLRTLEEQLHSFLNFKDQAEEELKKKLQGLKDLYLSQLQLVHTAVLEHEDVSSSTLKSLDSKVAAHPKALEQLLVSAVADAQSVIHDLQESLSNQSQELAEFAQHQRQVAQKCLQAARDITRTIMASLSAIEVDTANFNECIIFSSANHDKGLHALAEAYEEHARKDHTQLLESITAMLASSLGNRTNLVHTRIKKLREVASQHAHRTKHGLEKIQQEAITANGKLNTFTATAGASSLEDATMFATSVSRMDEILQSSTSHTTTSGRKWESIKKEVNHLVTSHTAAATSILREGLEANANVLVKLQGLQDTARLKIEAQNNNTVAFINGTCTGEHEAACKMQSTMKLQAEAAAELERSHESGLSGVQFQTDHHLKEEYLEDKPTCSTPRKRTIQVPTPSSIIALCTPPLDMLLKEFRAKHAVGGPVRLSKVFQSVEASFRDSRTPLTIIN